MAISVYSCGYLGIESYIVEIETDISNGLPVFNIVGMGDLAILESKERIRSCFKNIVKIRNVDNFKNYLILGEISLNGEIKSVKGAINATILA